MLFHILSIFAESMNNITFHRGHNLLFCYYSSHTTLTVSLYHFSYVSSCLLLLLLRLGKMFSLGWMHSFHFQTTRQYIEDRTAQCVPQAPVSGHLCSKGSGTPLYFNWYFLYFPYLLFTYYFPIIAALSLS